MAVLLSIRFYRYHILYNLVTFLKLLFFTIDACVPLVRWAHWKSLHQLRCDDIVFLMALLGPVYAPLLVEWTLGCQEELPLVLRLVEASFHGLGALKGGTMVLVTNGVVEICLVVADHLCLEILFLFGELVVAISRV